MLFTKVAFLASVVASVSAQSIVDVLTKYATGGVDQNGKNITSDALIGAAKAVNLVDTLAGLKDPLTLFAPTDAAFAKLTTTPDADTLKSVLLYHVSNSVTYLPKDPRTFVDSLLKNPSNFDKPTQVRLDFDSAGNTVTANFGLSSANVVYSDTTLLGGKGVVHFIDTVLLPPPKVSDVVKPAKLNALTDLLVKYQLVSPIESLKGITILAPSDAAFTAIADVVKTLTDDEIKAVLELHILPGVIRSTDLPSGSTPGVQTYLNSDKLTATVGSAGVQFAGAGNNGTATVKVADVLIQNGIVHVIDTVLLPKNLVPNALTQITPGGESTTSTSQSATTSAPVNTAKTTTNSNVSYGSAAGHLVANQLIVAGAVAVAALFV